MIVLLASKGVDGRARLIPVVDFRFHPRSRSRSRSVVSTAPLYMSKGGLRTDVWWVEAGSRTA